MRHLIVASVLLLGLGSAAQAATETPEVKLIPRLEPMEQVDHIPALTALDSWRAIDNDTLIVWASPARPYLVELARPSPDLISAEAIGVTSVGSKVHANLDSIVVRGMSYPIREIYRLSRDDARLH